MPAVGALKEVPVASGVLLTEGLDADPPTVVVVVEGAVLEVLMVMEVLAVLVPVKVPVVVPGFAGALVCVGVPVWASVVVGVVAALVVACIVLAEMEVVGVEVAVTKVLDDAGVLLVLAMVGSPMVLGDLLMAMVVAGWVLEVSMGTGALVVLMRAWVVPAAGLVGAGVLLVALRDEGLLLVGTVGAVALMVVMTAVAGSEECLVVSGVMGVKALAGAAGSLLVVWLIVCRCFIVAHCVSLHFQAFC